MAVAVVRHEAQRQRQPGQDQRPAVEVGEGAALGKADVRHPVMEVVAVGEVDGAAIAQPLRHDEAGIENRHRQHQQG